MRKKGEFLIYTGMWTVAVLILVGLLLQNLGDAKIVNYSGMVRGATQKLVKEELNGEQDDRLILQLDGIIQELRTGEGEFGLNWNGDRAYQASLEDIARVWAEIKDELYRYRAGQGSGETLYALSQTHFELADLMVQCAEQSAESRLLGSIVFYFVILALSIGIFLFLEHHSRRALEKSSFTDSLTGIRNRAGFEAAAEGLLRQRAGRSYVLLELDVNDFKFINSTYGYEFGDRLLGVISETLEACCEEGEACGRLDADDFVALLCREPLLLNDLRCALGEAIREQLNLDVSNIISFTVGGYTVPEENEPVQSMMDKVNLAHRGAKKQGASATLWYSTALLEKMQQENQLKNRMRRALEEEEFKLYLQPKCELAGLEIFGAEALVRWEFPGRGLVYPDEFIPLFEANGAIVDLDFYMLNKTCAYIRARMDKGEAPLSISVNFSRVTIYSRSFQERVLEIVDHCRVPHGCIELEITESAFNEIPEDVVETLMYLQEEGFRVSMDDFGAGYSNLNLLDKLPIQVLKLDREFLWEFEQNERAKNVITCVVELAHSLGVKVVCEGVECPEHLAFLQKIGCDYGQGYYFSKPVPQEAFSTGLKEIRASCAGTV